MTTRRTFEGGRVVRHDEDITGESGYVPARLRGKRAPAPTPRPYCRQCGKPLRRVREWQERDSKGGKVWGDYGDNFFCGLRCGYTFAVSALRMNSVPKRAPQPPSIPVSLRVTPEQAAANAAIDNAAEALRQCDQLISDGEAVQARRHLVQYRAHREAGGAQPVEVAGSSKNGDAFADYCETRLEAVIRDSTK